MKRGVLDLIKGMNKIRRDIEKSQRKVTVIFADMVDSTRLKYECSPSEVFLRLFFQNNAIIEAIKEKGGNVVRFLGDGIMGYFEGKAATINALKAALLIQKKIAKINNSLDIPKIATKIALDYGPVFFFDFPGTSIPDLQGSTVDIAARLCSLAKSGQIICTDKVVSRVKKEPVVFSGVEYRSLKGIRGLEKIFEVKVSGRFQGIAESAHYSYESEEMKDMLSTAIKQYRKNPDNAIELFKRVLKNDPLNYKANYYLCCIYAYVKVDYTEALKYARQAKQSNPFSPIPHKMIAYCLWNLYGDKPPEEIYTEIVQETEEALKLANEQCLPYEKEIIENNLAYYYALGEEAEKLKKSLELCEMIESASLMQIFWASFLDTFAFILMKLYPEDLEKLKQAKAKMQEAIQLEGDNDILYEHYAQLLRKITPLEKKG